MAWTTLIIRTPGKVNVSWWNTLRAAIVELQNFVGLAGVPLTGFTIANNQVAAANVTGLLFSSAANLAANIEVSIRRKTATALSEVVATGFLSVTYREQSSLWEVTPILNGDDTGVTFSITAGGQVQYTSTNIAGTSYVGKMSFKAAGLGLGV